MPRRVIVLRHGQSTHNAEGRWQGQTDPHLSALGREQVAAAARVLAAAGVTRVVASDLSRAAETGRAVAAAAGVPIEYEPAFREIDVGTWAGRLGTDVLAEDAELIARIHAGEDLPRGGGERVSDVHRRAAPALRRHLRGLGPGETLVIAAHGMVGGVLVASLLGEDPVSGGIARDVLRNAHWAELADDGDGWGEVAWDQGAG